MLKPMVSPRSVAILGSLDTLYVPKAFGRDNALKHALVKKDEAI